MKTVQNNFGIKYGNRKNIAGSPNGLIRWKKNYKESKKALRRTYTWNRSEQHSENYRIGKHQAIMEYMDSGFENSHASTMDLSLQLNICLEEAKIPKWMTNMKLILSTKTPQTGAIPINYSQITRLPMTQKILTPLIMEGMYSSLICNGSFRKKRKGFLKRTRRISDLLFID